MKFLHKGDTIIVAWAEPAKGPGWSNRPIWVIIRDRQFKLRQECIQPEDQDYDTMMLYNVSALVTADFTSAVRNIGRKKVQVTVKP